MTSESMSRIEPLSLHRVYETVDEGYRILVDRLWPRGVSKDVAALDEWAKDVGPSTALRQWYDHEISRFGEFKRRYIEELERSPAREIGGHILDLTTTESVVLLTATRDVKHSAAQVLLEHLRREHQRRRRQTVDDVVDGWGRDSFPASDPPGRLPPTLADD